MSKLGTPWL